MRHIRIMLLALAPLVALGACTSFTDQDRAELRTTSQNAEAAKQQAAEANATAQRALQTSQAAAADAKAANEKADRMFQRSQRK